MVLSFCVNGIKIIYNLPKIFRQVFLYEEKCVKIGIWMDTNTEK